MRLYWNLGLRTAGSRWGFHQTGFSEYQQICHLRATLLNCFTTYPWNVKVSGGVTNGGHILIPDVINKMATSPEIEFNECRPRVLQLRLLSR